MPRAGLTPTVVVDEASRLADEVGFDQLTLATIAKRLGVALPSLYKHVEGLDAVRQRIAARATADLADVLTDAAAGRARTDALAAVAHAFRRYARTHPGRYHATVRAPRPTDRAHQVAATRAVTVFTAILHGYGITDAAAIDATRFIRSTLHGFVLLETAGGFGLPQDLDTTFEALVAALDRALSSWTPHTPRS